MGAPNPWHHSLSPVDPKSVLLEGENPLEIIRELLLRWPGEATVKQKDRIKLLYKDDFRYLKKYYN